MYTCPECGRETVERREVCWCGADLSLLAAMEGTLDAWHNEGAAAAEAGDWPRTLEWFAACAVARPTDVDALTVLARVWVKLGHPTAALRLLDRAAELEAENSDRADLRALALEAARELAAFPSSVAPVTPESQRGPKVPAEASPHSTATITTSN